MKIYDKILSEEEIQDVYVKGAGYVPVKEISLTDWLKLDGKYHNVVMTSDGKKVKIYVDGKLKN